MRILLWAGVFFISLYSTVQAAEPDQEKISNDCALVTEDDQAPITVCVEKIRLSATLFTSHRRGYCVVELNIREDGTVSRVNPTRVKPRRALESVCVRNGFKWRFDVRDEEGNPTSIKAFRVLVYYRHKRDIDLGPELGRMGLQVAFDDETIATLTN